MENQSGQKPGSRPGQVGAAQASGSYVSFSVLTIVACLLTGFGVYYSTKSDPNLQLATKVDKLLTRQEKATNSHKDTIAQIKSLEAALHQAQTRLDSVSAPDKGAGAVVPAQTDKSPASSDVSSVLEEAGAAFARGDKARGTILTTAALAMAPYDKAALALFEEHGDRSIKDALEQKKWQTAAEQIETYAQVVVQMVARCRSQEHAMLAAEHRKKLDQHKAQLTSALEQEARAIVADVEALDDPQQEALDAIYVRLNSLSNDMFSEAPWRAFGVASRRLRGWEPDAQRDVSSLIKLAGAAFQSGDEVRGTILTSAALTMAPHDRDVLTLFQARMNETIERALKQKQWSVVAEQLAAYDQVIAQMIAKCESQQQASLAVEHQKTLDQHKQTLTEALELEAKAILADIKVLDEPQPKALDAINARIKALPTNLLSERAWGTLREVTPHRRRLEIALHQKDIEQRIVSLEAAFEKVSSEEEVFNLLQEAESITQALFQHKDVKEASSEMWSRVRALQSKGQQQLAKQTQEAALAESDADVVIELGKIDKIYEQAEACQHNRNAIWQKCIAIAKSGHVQLSSVSPHVLPETQTRIIQTRERFEYMNARYLILQRQWYNETVLKRLSICAKTVKEEEAKVFSSIDRDKVKRQMKECFGPTNTDYLFPPVMSYYGQLLAKMENLLEDDKSREALRFSIIKDDKESIHDF